MSLGYSMLDAGYKYCVNGDSIAVIPVRTGIHIFVILSPSLRSRVNSAKDLAVGNED